jgi:hypothetical protein
VAREEEEARRSDEKMREGGVVHEKKYIVYSA